ncbi:hypothetical protein KY386_00435 [Candidatus Parcubacteria bacterium]|nr:hypothetical protein [Candidatus Parcubacteria bacterium]
MAKVKVIKPKDFRKVLEQRLTEQELNSLGFNLSGLKRGDTVVLPWLPGKVWSELDSYISRA